MRRESAQRIDGTSTSLSLSSSIISDSDLKEQIQKYRIVLRAIGESFRGLRTIDPNDKDLEMTKRAIAVVGQYWGKLGIQATPKLFNLLHIASRHQRKLNLACLAEDFVERKHQDGLRDKRRNACLLNYKDKTADNIQRRTMKTDPNVAKLQENAYVHSKRKRLTETDRFKEKQAKKNRERAEKDQIRHEFYRVHCNYNIITGEDVDSV